VSRRLSWLDVFTATPLTGNQLPVVHDADGLSDAQMLAFARETNQSETSFLQSPTEPGADYRNRIWMTTGELAFAGHPSLGAAVAFALERGETEATYVQQTRPGLQPCDVRVTGPKSATASMLQEPPEYRDELDPAELARAAGLEAAQPHPDLPPQIVWTGLTQLIFPVLGSHAAARPDVAHLAPLLERTGATTLYVAMIDEAGARADTRSFYMGTDGPREDAATGSAAGPLLAYAHARLGLERLTVAQGVAMGRASRIDCSWENDRPRVGGDVVLVASGTVDL
jgi:trans-2,3-dihydro-3-hydroxyanthranilate isomerase